MLVKFNFSLFQSPRESPAAAIEEVITTAQTEAPSEAEPAEVSSEAEPAEATPTGDEPPETTPAPGTVQVPVYPLYV